MSAHTVLSKIFSREKPFFYFQLWNDTDRLGFKDFLGHDVAHSVFLVPPGHEKGSVWYAISEWKEITECLRKKVREDEKELIRRVAERADAHWPALLPYLKREKLIESADDLTDYYAHLVQWWSAMTSVWELPNIEEPSAEARDLMLGRRAIGEKYTEEMSKVMVEGFERLYPDATDLSHYVCVVDVVRLARGETSLEALRAERLSGCVLVDEILYPYSTLSSALDERGLVLEEEQAIETKEVKGTTAYKGLVRGVVRKIHTKAQMKEFLEGEILVTEMTNPDYVPIMKMAGAIVTDEGGMMCHASIVSREMKIPCVVGTKIATKVFRDGDLVEVDAEKGTVRKV